MHGWEEVLTAATSEAKALAYQRAVVGAVERFFPLRTVKRKDTDPPWMNKKTKKLLEDRKKLFVEEGGRTATWKLEKKKQMRLVETGRGASLTDREKKFYKKMLVDISIEMSEILAVQKGPNCLM